MISTGPEQGPVSVPHSSRDTFAWVKHMLNAIYLIPREHFVRYEQVNRITIGGEFGHPDPSIPWRQIAIKTANISTVFKFAYDPIDSRIVAVGAKQRNKVGEYVTGGHVLTPYGRTERDGLRLLLYMFLPTRAGLALLQLVERWCQVTIERIGNCGIVIGRDPLESAGGFKT